MERRLAAILAADVVGYSRLIRENEAGTLAALKADREQLIEPKVTEHSGRIVKLMGDGLLVEFPSAVEAIECAIEIQHMIGDRNAAVSEEKRITYRIGINIGDIVVEDDDIYGDGVNLAARLESLAEPGGICVARNVFNQVKDKLDLTIEHMGEREVKNISEPVTVYRVVLDDKAAALVTPVVHDASKPVRRRWMVAAAALLVAAAVGGVSWWQAWTPEFEPASVERMALPLPEKPSIAVLPFNNFSDDPEQDYFADGMTEDLITDLSKLSGIFVISRNSSWTFKGRAVKAQQVAEELGVRYILEGSVRRRGGQVRINAQLIDAIGGHHLWAERYDGTMDGVFALQDKVIGEIVKALAVNLTSAEKADLGQAETKNPQAYDALLQGLEQLRHDTEEGTQKAISLLEKAIELDPDYSRAYAGLAAANWRITVSLWGSSSSIGFEHAWERFNQYLTRAMKRPTSLAHATAAQFHALHGHYDEAFDQINRAMALAPNDPDSHISKAKILNATGRAAEAEKAARWALRLDPQYAPEYLRVLALSLFHQERYEEAVETLRRVVSLQSDVVEDYSTLVSGLGHLGRMEEVPALIEKYNSTAVPAFFDPLTAQEAGWWWYGDVFDYHAPYLERLQAGLRKAGVPEGAGTDLSREDYMRFIVKTDDIYSVTGATKIDAVTAKALYDRGGVRFVDVRAVLDFDKGHIPGAINLSLITDLSKAGLSKTVGKDEEVVFSCHGKHCPYSAYASAKALAWGFTRVYRFAGGYPAWHDAGYPIEVTPTQ